MRIERFLGILAILQRSGSDSGMSYSNIIVSRPEYDVKLLFYLFLGGMPVIILKWLYCQTLGRIYLLQLQQKYHVPNISLSCESLPDKKYRGRFIGTTIVVNLANVALNGIEAVIAHEFWHVVQQKETLWQLQLLSSVRKQFVRYGLQASFDLFAPHEIEARYFELYRTRPPALLQKVEENMIYNVKTQFAIRSFVALAIQELKSSEHPEAIQVLGLTAVF